LCGHSLGSIIAFDVLSPPEGQSRWSSKGLLGIGSSTDVESLRIEFSALIALGSPIGYFMAMRGAKLGPSFTLRPRCERLYNVFAKHDPVAYRLEPLLADDEDDVAAPAPAAAPSDSSLTPEAVRARLSEYGMVGDDTSGAAAPRRRRPIDAEPQTVPTPRQAGVITATGKNLTRAFSATGKALSFSAKFLVGGGGSGSDDLGNDTLDEPPFNLNDGGRVDWQLQAAELELQNAYLVALNAHGCYWSSEDVAAFIVNEVVIGWRVRQRLREASIA